MATVSTVAPRSLTFIVPLLVGITAAFCLNSLLLGLLIANTAVMSYRRKVCALKQDLKHKQSMISVAQSGEGSSYDVQAPNAMRSPGTPSTSSAIPYGLTTDTSAVTSGTMKHSAYSMTTGTNSRPRSLNESSAYMTSGTSNPMTKSSASSRSANPPDVVSRNSAYGMTAKPPDVVSKLYTA